MNGSTLIDPDGLAEGLLEIVKPELAPGERLLWASQQVKWVEKGATAWVGVAWVVVLFVVSAVTMAAFLGVFGTKFDQIGSLVGGIGVVSGVIGLLVGFSLFAAWTEKAIESRRKVKLNSYALTDRRAIIWEPILGSSGVRVFAYARGEIKHIYRNEYPDGSGDVVFELTSSTTIASPRMFGGVADVRLVEDLVRRALLVDDADPAL